MAERNSNELTVGWLELFSLRQKISYMQRVADIQKEMYVALVKDFNKYIREHP